MELLRDRSRDFEQAGARVFGVSRDSPWTHIAWTQALDLNFPLVSDWNAEAIRGFGIAREFRGYEDVAVRSAFLVGRDGTIRAAWHYDDGEVPDVDELLAAARS
jgi:peroxiredoxin